MDKVHLGYIYRHDFVFNQRDVDKFAELTGDNNPIHIDSDYAAKTIFKRRIIHGFLAGSVLSKVFGTLFPGEGTIYLSQEMKFLKPMYTDIPYTSEFEVMSIDQEKNRAIIDTKIYDEKRKVTLTGQAIVLNRKVFI